MNAHTEQAQLEYLLTKLATDFDIDRPLVVLDLESTGTNPELDRIVELTIARVEGCGDGYNVRMLHTLVNPGIPIPAEATAVHGITNEQAAEAPPFHVLARQVAQLLAGADVIGFNHRRFDVRLLASELRQCGIDNPCEAARLIDVGLIFMKREPRTLSAALQFFCGEAHEDAHGTTADVIATLKVLHAQFERYEDLPRDVDALDAIGRDPSFIDREGKLVWRGGQACIGFGKYQGVPLRQVDPGSMRWMLEKDFPSDTKTIVRAALRGIYPTAPPAAAAVAEPS